MQALGQQILADFYGCDVNILNNEEMIKLIMCEAALVSGATIVNHTFHKFSPHGVSGAVIIAESHLAIHTWPEYGFAAVDLFTCGDTIMPDACYHFLKERLKAKDASMMELKRGIMRVPSKLLHKPDAE